jgi:hypothetical protein
VFKLGDHPAPREGSASCEDISLPLALAQKSRGNIGALPENELLQVRRSLKSEAIIRAALLLDDVHGGIPHPQVHLRPYRFRRRNEVEDYV